MRTLSLVVALAASALVGCATPCDESRDVLFRRCGIEVEGDTDMACIGEREAYAQCILDHPDEACEYFYDPLVAEGNAFDLCVRAIPPD